MSQLETKTPASERQNRLQKLLALEKAGLNPYPAKARRDRALAETQRDFASLEKSGADFYLCGRLRRLRAHGNLTFADLGDASGKLQIAFSQKEVGEKSYRDFSRFIDTGDFLEVKGHCFTTKTSEPSFMVKSWRLLAKSLRPIPDAWFGLKDEEERYRRRYLDIILNPEVKDMILKRAKFWQAARQFLLARGFIEVETPVLETLPGGADARPFVTHHYALDMDVYLRISMGELWQKKLMVAGLEKTFEIGRQFRNEGMDAEHLQDYTQLEFYWAYTDYEMGMALVTELYRYLAKETFGTLKFKIKEFTVDLGGKWERYDYRKTVKNLTGLDVLKISEKDIKKKLNELKVEYDKDGFNLTRALDNLWKYCRKQLAGPGFLVGTPITISPLAKRDEKHPDVAQRFQVILAGSEMGNGYSELNNPLDQEERFKEQQKLREAGDEEAQRHDKDFVEAMEYGLPPTCGFGMSERYFSFLMNKPARETQIFPLMKPKN